MPRKHASRMTFVKKVRKTTVAANQRIAAGSKNRMRKLTRKRSRWAEASLAFVVLLPGRIPGNRPERE
jgi:hypothetical protein